jgi:pimeloyl-ACP methyl ester carboxylesterase
MKVNGVDLDVSINGNGRPFIWSHGLMSCRAGEDESKILNVAAVADAVLLVRYDLRGHGKSKASFAPQDYTFQSYGNDLIGLADAAGINGFVAGGASLGCGVSIYAALDAPDRVEALVLVIPPTAWETRKAQTETYALGVSMIENDGLAAMAEVLKQNPIFPPKFLTEEFPDEADVYLKYFSSQGEKTAACILGGAALSDLPAKQKLQQITCPTLILAWTNDPGHPVETAEELKVQLPKSVLKIAETPAEVLKWPDYIKDFIAYLK